MSVDKRGKEFMKMLRNYVRCTFKNQNRVTKIRRKQSRRAGVTIRDFALEVWREVSYSACAFAGTLV